MKTIKWIAALSLLSALCFGATFTSLKVGDGAPINASAALEVKSTTQAILVPRMTTTQKNAIASPANGDLIYDTTLNQFSGYQSGAWSTIGGSSLTFSDSLVDTSNVVTLVNDSASPGASKYYGTNGSSTLGYFALPTSAVWGSITGTLSSQTDLYTALGLLAPLASPTFTGTVTGTFSGNLTGNVTGNVSGSSGSTTGNAATATALASTPSGCSTGQYADSIAASGNLTCAAVQYSQLGGSTPTWNQNTTGNAATATALFSLPSQCTSGDYATGVATSGNANCSQVNYNQLAGVLPNPSVSSLGGIESLAAVSHKWINTISTGGAPSATQPACSDLSGVAASCSIDTTNASNISSGTLGVSEGGTGINSITAGYVLVGNGTGTPTLVAPGFGGNILTSNGSAWVAATPAPTSISNPLNFTQLSAVPTPSPSPGHDIVYTDTNDNLWLGTSTGAQEQVGPGMVGTNPAAYTPTIVGMGTVTGEAFYWWRKGPDIIIQGGFTCGTPSGVPISISLPGTLTSASTLSTNQVVGSFVIDTPGAGSFTMLMQPSSSSMNMGSQLSGASGYNPADGNTICTSGEAVTLTAEFPVTGWTVASPPAPGQAGASIFFSATPVTTLSSAITGSSYTTFSNSPTVSFTPTVTGTYNCGGSLPINLSSGTGDSGYVQIANTSGSATLLNQSQGTLYGAANANVTNIQVNSFYTLTAGTAYAFDVQGETSGGYVYLDARGMSAYMVCYLYAALGVNATTIGAPIDIGLPQFNDTGVFSQFTSTVSGYAQSIWQNLSSGSTASTDLIVNNDQGTATTHYGDFGINSSGFTGSGSLQIAGATYLYSQTGDLVLATNTSNALHILTNDSTTDAITVTSGNNVQINTALQTTERTETGNYTVDATAADQTIWMNCSAACTLTLPAPTAGRNLTVVDVSGQSQIYNITLAEHASETINGVAASYLMASNGGTWTITSDGTNWWVSDASLRNWAFGGGTDGAISITASNTSSGPLTSGSLTRDAYWSKLTMGASGSFKTAGFKVFAQVCDFSVAITGAITATPAAAGNGAAVATAGSAGALPYASAGTLGVATVGIIGGIGGATTGTEGAAATAVSPGMGGPSGGGSLGGTGTGGAGGAARAAVAVTTPWGMPRFATDLIRGIVLGQGGGGAPGGSGAGGNTTAGGGGGGGGAGGGVIYVACGVVIRGTNTNPGIIQAEGGAGGNGGTTATSGAGGGGGGPGGGGGEIYFLYSFETGSAISDALDVSGGSSGTGGSAVTSGDAGASGGGGGGGRIDVCNITSGTCTETFGGTATTSNAASGTSGGSAKAGQVTQANL